MKCVSWNVNGIRAAQKKGLMDFIKEMKPELMSFQEIKAHPDQLDKEISDPAGYDAFWHPAEKKGYSGVSTWSRIPPEDVIYGFPETPELDKEGRVLTLDFGDWVLINAYFPNSQRERARLPYKLQFCEEMLKTCKAWEKAGRTVLLCGDYNIAHRPIDLARPKQNEDNAGYLPEERDWMDTFTDSGMIDTFRHFYPETPDQYSWWSFRARARERNVGWRLDYYCIDKNHRDDLKKAWIMPEVLGSDHCPVGVELRY
jgi:exodeoxyribonuclease-3